MWAGYRSARLSTRLLLIVLTCLVPIIALAVWVEYGHWAERRAQLGDLALQQAELLNGDVESIADGARSPAEHGGADTCGPRPGARL